MLIYILIGAVTLIGLLALWSGFVFMFGDNDEKGAMSFVLFFGVIGIIQLAFFFVGVYGLYYLVNLAISSI